VHGFAFKVNCDWPSSEMLGGLFAIEGRQRRLRMRVRTGRSECLALGVEYVYHSRSGICMPLAEWYMYARCVATASLVFEHRPNRLRIDRSLSARVFLPAVSPSDSPIRSYLFHSIAPSFLVGGRKLGKHQAHL